eukprot:16180397-Heterocapsa_arctica.AAC.1
MHQLRPSSTAGLLTMPLPSEKAETQHGHVDQRAGQPLQLDLAGHHGQEQREMAAELNTEDIDQEHLERLLPIDDNDPGRCIARALAERPETPQVAEEARRDLDMCQCTRTRSRSCEREMNLL